MMMTTMMMMGSFLFHPPSPPSGRSLLLPLPSSPGPGRGVPQRVGASKMAQDGSKGASESPRWPPIWLKTAQDASRSLQDAQDRLRDRPRRPQEASIRLQSVQDRLQDRSSRSQTVSNTLIKSLAGSCQVLARFLNTPEMFACSGQAQGTPAKAVAKLQGWSGGGSTA